MNRLKYLSIVFFLCMATLTHAQTIQSEQLIGNWDLTKYEFKSKDEQMNLLFDNSNVDSSFNLLVSKMTADSLSKNNVPTDSIALLKKQYIQQVKYLSKSYFKFLPQGKCKYNLINDRQKFKTQEDTYTVKDNTIVLGDGSKYKIILLTATKITMQSNAGKMQFTYTKQ